MMDFNLTFKSEAVQWSYLAKSDPEDKSGIMTIAGKNIEVESFPVAAFIADIVNIAFNMGMNKKRAALKTKIEHVFVEDGS